MASHTQVKTGVKIDHPVIDFWDPWIFMDSAVPTQGLSWFFLVASLKLRHYVCIRSVSLESKFPSAGLPSRFWGKLDVKTPQTFFRLSGRF